MVDYSSCPDNVGCEKKWNKDSPAKNRNNRVHDQAGDVKWGWSVHADHVCICLAITGINIEGGMNVGASQMYDWGRAGRTKGKCGV